VHAKTYPRYLTGLSSILINALLAGHAFSAEMDLTQLSLQELMAMEVVSASRRVEQLSDTAAAVYVITSEDIAGSSATTLPELLATVPGLHVAQINANAWAVSARDFNGRFANKLLVMIDGRTIYTPLFSGVFWEWYDLILEDIERVEVIRGPGASVWGANAVNGIINIITKNAAETRGSYARALVGTNERVATLRHGGNFTEGLDYRVFLKLRGHDSQDVAPDVQGEDDWRTVTTGFRVDSNTVSSDMFRLDGGLFYGEFGDTVSMPIFAPPHLLNLGTQSEARGAYISGQWTHAVSPGSSFETRAFYHHSHFEDLRLTETRNVIDIDAQHTFALTPQYTLVWGGGIRHSWDEIVNSDLIGFADTEEAHTIYNAFGQITAGLMDYRLLVTAGSKWEHNEYTGAEIQPTLRALWRFNERHKIWSAVSRAVRTPSRAEDGILGTAAVIPGTIVPPTPPTEISFVGNSNLEAENLFAIEAGYRGFVGTELSFDLTAYHHTYEDLIVTAPGMPFFDVGPPARVVAPLELVNDGTGDVWGFEAVMNWQPLADLRFELTYGYVEASIRGPMGPTVQTSPYHLAALRALYQVTDRVYLNATGRYIGRTPSSGLGNYVDLDANIRWALGDRFELTFAGRNLVSGKRREFEPENVFAGAGSLNGPNAFVALSWRN
jgi:iron complex outermembrane receptor protein